MQVKREPFILALVFIAAMLNGCARKQEVKEEVGKFPEPRFPSYLKAPQSIDEIMPYARELARNKSWRGGLGLGVVNSGESILIVVGAEAEDMIMQAIQRALEERGVKVQILRDYELVKVSKEDALALRKVRRAFTSELGYMEAADWVENQFPDPEAAKRWLKERRPDLHDILFPKNRELPKNLKEVERKLERDNVGRAIQDYLKQHPEIKGVFWGKGGGAGLARALHPYEDKYMGFFTADNRWEVISKIPSFPGDVWQLAEEQSMEPLAYVDKFEANDPEGTNVWSDITEEMAQRWVKGAYQRGHLYMFPTQATGRFAFSFIDYPALDKEWIPREPMPLINGVIAGTNGHTGFFPRIEVHYKDGYVTEAKGGGPYGEALREFLQYPKINEVTYPFHNHRGFWYLYEIAFGTNPKWFRNPAYMEMGSLGPERNRSGVIHWGVGLRLWHDPDAPVESKSWLDFTAKHNLPMDHGFHIHTYFTTYRVHLRNTDKWVTLIDRGRLTSLDNPEVRALASRYGNPDQILAEDWIPEIPGINAPGRYEDYAANPWRYSKAVIDKALAGNYEHFYPSVASAQK